MKPSKAPYKAKDFLIDLSISIAAIGFIAVMLAMALDSTATL